MRNTKFLFGAVATTMMAVSVLGGTCLTASASEISIDEMREHLISVQFSERYVNTVSEEKVQYLYGLTQKYYISHVERKTCYLTESNENEIMPMGSISTKYLSFTITLYHITAERMNPILLHTLVSVEYDWVTLPAYKLTDAIIVNWDSNVYTYRSDSFGSYDYVEIYSSYNGETYTYETCLERPTAITQGGLGYDVCLRDHGPAQTKLYGCADFELLPTKSPMYIEKNLSAQYFSTTSINVQYAHNWKSFSTGVGFTMTGPSISFASSYKVDTTATSTNVRYNVY